MDGVESGSNKIIVGAIEQSGSTYKRFHNSCNTYDEWKMWIGSNDGTYVNVGIKSYH